MCIPVIIVIFKISFLLIAFGGVLVFTYTQYEKVIYGKRKPPELQYKLKMAKVRIAGTLCLNIHVIFVRYQF